MSTEEKIAEWERRLNEDSQGNTNEYNVAWEAVEEVKLLHLIVRDLAAIDMRTCNPAIERACPLCMVDLEHGDVPHAESCPWRRAVEAGKP